MSDSQPPDDFRKQKQKLPPAFQFNISTLLLATVVCAVIVSFISRFELPALGRCLLAFIAIFYVLYFMLRFPGILMRQRTIQRQLAQSRCDVLNEAWSKLANRLPDDEGNSN